MKDKLSFAELISIIKQKSFLIQVILSQTFGHIIKMSQTEPCLSPEGLDDDGAKKDEES